ncbi:MAG: hypothetical protein AAF901_00305 [Bacteroidota bacterium]
MKILVAHSNEQRAGHIKATLESIGFNDVVTVNHGFQALDHIVRHHYNLCLLEKDLTGLNAKDISNAIRFKGIKTKLIILNSSKGRGFIRNRNIIARLDLNETNAHQRLLSAIKKELEALRMSS